jgi:uncharacterized protein
MVLEGNAAELESRAQRNRPGIDYDFILPAIFIALWGSVFGGAILFAVLVPRFGRKIGPKRYRGLGMDWDLNNRGGSGRSSGGSSWSSGRSSGGFSGGGGSSGGGGASGRW